MYVCMYLGTSICVYMCVVYRLEHHLKVEIIELFEGIDSNAHDANSVRNLSDMLVHLALSLSLSLSVYIYVYVFISLYLNTIMLLLYIYIYIHILSSHRAQLNHVNISYHR